MSAYERAKRASAERARRIVSDRGFTPWEHEPDEFDRWADEDCRERDWIDDGDDDDLEAWLANR